MDSNTLGIMVVFLIRCLIVSIILSMATAQSRYISKASLPKDSNWVSLDPGVEFLPAGDANKLHRRSLEESIVTEESTTTESNGIYTVQPFVEGVSDYDEYQQAWRLLGFMIDCDANVSDDDASHDSGDARLGCRRFVLWAAYVDLDYQGGGIGEYVYWDDESNAWDRTACEYTGSSRCAKMDCHLPSTHWSLLGFFKHRNYDDWMEQLFKHEGYCIWQNNEYSFMNAVRETWPQGCTATGSYDEEGNALYYDVKPVQGGGITVGLYTDTKCVKEYQTVGNDDPITVENILGNFMADGDASGDDYVVYDTLEQSMEAWDAAFRKFTTCQPCLAHDLLNYGYSGNGEYGANYGKYNYGNGDDAYNNNNNGNDFDCYDMADYTNVNQCMKFMAKTTMKTATFRDLSLAYSQGTLVDSPLQGYRHFQRYSPIVAFLTYVVFLAAMAFFIIGLRRFLRKRKEHNFAPNWSVQKPLVFA